MNREEERRYLDDERERLYCELRQLDAMISGFVVLIVLLLLAALVIGAVAA